MKLAISNAIEILKHNTFIYLEKEFYYKTDGTLNSTWISIGACEQNNALNC